MTTTTTIPPSPWPVSAEEYHRPIDEDGTFRWSSSMFATYWTSPLLAYRRYIAKTLPRHIPQSRSMAIGSAVHALHLAQAEDPHSLEDLVIAPTRARNTKRFADAQAAAPAGAIVLTEAESETATLCHRAITRPQSPAAELAKDLLNRPGRAEWSAHFTAAGTPCKMRADRLVEAGGKVHLVELKTTVDPSPESFPRTAARWHYTDRLGLYRVGLQHHGLELRPDATFVVIGNAEPYDVAVYTVHPQRLRAAEANVSATAAAIAAGLWSATWQTGSIPLYE